MGGCLCLPTLPVTSLPARQQVLAPLLSAPRRRASICAQLPRGIRPSPILLPCPACFAEYDEDEEMEGYYVEGEDEEYDEEGE